MWAKQAALPGKVKYWQRLTKKNAKLWHNVSLPVCLVPSMIRIKSRSWIQCMLGIIKMIHNRGKFYNLPLTWGGG